MLSRYYTPKIKKIPPNFVAFFNKFLHFIHNIHKVVNILYLLLIIQCHKKIKHNPTLSFLILTYAIASLSWYYLEKPILDFAHQKLKHAK